MKAAFYTLGCKVNQYETQILKQYFSADGYDIVNPEDDADVYVINSCTVTASGDKKTRQILHRFRKQNEKATIAVTGCMPQAFPEDLDEIMDADVITGSYNRKGLLTAVKKHLATGDRVIDITPHEKRPEFETMEATDFDGRTRAFLKIQDGCRRFCAYCIIPKARGGLRSKPMEDIEKEVKALVSSGYSEIVLVGINLSCYGIESTGSLIEVIEMISKIDGVKRIRLGSLEPEMLTHEHLQRMAKLDNFCPQFHLSMQSGSDTTLKRMTRHYTCDEYMAIVDDIRDSFENPSITTDVMVGFPGETDEEFEETIEFVKKVKLAKAHVFSYSRRPGTKADEMENQVPQEIKSKRSKELIKVTDVLHEEFLKSQVGTFADVLFETPLEGGYYQGYSKNYTPVMIKSDISLAGKDMKVKIIDIKDGHCLAIEL